MSKPYTAQDPFHSSTNVTIKRQAKCKGCSQEDPTGVLPWVDGIISKGEAAIKCVIGSGPFTRTQHFHPNCYFTIRSEAAAAFLDPAWKVQRPQVSLTVLNQQDEREEDKKPQNKPIDSLKKSRLECFN